MSPSKEVLKYYPYAKVIQVNRHFEIHLNTLNDGYVILGKGKNRRCAWKSASRNI